MFRPLNSSESNLYTIRASLGFGSKNGLFNFSTAVTNSNYVIAAGTSPSIPITSGYNYLSSPSSSNLPLGFYISLNRFISGQSSTLLTNSNNNFKINYGVAFTSQPSITILPNFVKTNSVPIINSITVNVNKQVLAAISSTSISAANLTFISGYDSTLSSPTTGLPIPPSLDGITGLLGFDIVITGPVQVGVNSGNKNKGWGLNSTIENPSGIYTLLDTNIGSNNIIDNSIVISKNLKFLGSDGNVKTYTSAITNSLDYSQTVWVLANSTTTPVVVNSLQPQQGMYLIIINRSVSTIRATINLNAGCTVNTYSDQYGSISTASFTLSQNGSITLYGISSNSFVVLNSLGAIY